MVYETCTYSKVTCVFLALLRNIHDHLALDSRQSPVLRIDDSFRPTEQSFSVTDQQASRQPYQITELTVEQQVYTSSGPNYSEHAIPKVHMANSSPGTTRSFFMIRPVCTSFRRAYMLIPDSTYHAHTKVVLGKMATSGGFVALEPQRWQQNELVTRSPECAG